MSERETGGIRAVPIRWPRLAPSTETGTLDGFPYVRVGDGPRALAVLPGFGDAMHHGRYPPGSGPMLAAYFARYLDEYAIYLLSRQRSLPAEYTIEDSADDHAGLLESELGPVDVLGISMGGLIGQQLCVRHPDLADRLVVASSACRLGESGRDPARRMLARARERDWFSIRAELVTGMFAGWRQVAYPPFVRTAGRFLLPRPADPEDVVVSLKAILAYDGCEGLDAIEQPTLVIGGSEDPYFTADVQRETAEGIPEGELSLISGKHGVFHERKGTFDRRVRRFLRRE